MNYVTIRENPTQFLSLTSLQVREFSWLLRHFTPRWESYYRYHTLEGKKRKIVSYREPGNALLKGTNQKLFFLLVYLKTNSLQQQQAASFGISQSKVSQIVRILLAVLDQTLHDLKLSPCRNGEDLQRSLANHTSKVFTYDGIERGIARNSDSDAQEEEFSGKKKSHRLKNNLLCDDFQYIHYLSGTENGATHDKAIADMYPMHLPLGSVLRQDLGFIGHRPVGVVVEQPFKKPKNGELSFSQLLYNQLFNPMRVVIEHANSGIKRLRMIKDNLRIHCCQFRDILMVVACGLHNLRVTSPSRNYFKPRAST